MRIYKHRVNTIKELTQTPVQFGLEIDIRSWGNELVVVHDPFVPPDVHLRDYLEMYQHNGLILNVKEEGLEDRILELLSEFSIEDFFFLDQTIPYMLKLLRMGEMRTAHKLSDVESIENLQLIIPKPEWVWVDSWSGHWNHLEQIPLLAQLGYKSCLCSPEIHRHDFVNELASLREFIRLKGIKFDIVCTKYPENWLA